LVEGTGRCEAFSDGVFAIAITLLILEIHVPQGGLEEGSLWRELRALWPSYVAFALSFFVILVTWISHHDLIRLVRGTDRTFHIANGLALCYVTFIPFSTAVLAAHLGGPERSAAVTFYCATFVAGSAAFNVLVAVILRDQLFRPGVEEILAGVRRGYQLTLLVYVAATLLALVLPLLALVVNVAVRLHLLRLHYQPAQTEPGQGAPAGG
jgi:uncharacterized membrane protein